MSLFLASILQFRYLFHIQKLNDIWIISIYHHPLISDFLTQLGFTIMEIFKDKQIPMDPVDEAGAMEMINSLKIKPLLDGARGRQACDKKALAKALANFSNLIYELGDLM